jgi:hypothetical protein
MEKDPIVEEALDSLAGVLDSLDEVRAALRVLSGAPKDVIVAAIKECQVMLVIADFKKTLLEQELSRRNREEAQAQAKLVEEAQHDSSVQAAQV